HATKHATTATPTSALPAVRATISTSETLCQGRVLFFHGGRRGEPGGGRGGGGGGGGQRWRRKPAQEAACVSKMLARSTSWPRTLRTISRTVFAGTQIVPCRWCLREGTPSSTGVSTGSVRFGRRSKVFLLQRT
ncbi:unnamed protein product, partial [Pylaiella littoralis]